MTEKTHSSFAPSSMDRLLLCPASHAMQKLVEQTASTFSAEGNIAHVLAEKALTDGKFEALAYLGQELSHTDREGTTTAIVTEDMCKNVQTYIDSVTQRVKAFEADPQTKKVTFFVEKQLDTSTVTGQPGHGRIDTMILAERHDGTATLTVEDLKYGKGVPIVAENNAQLMTYAASAIAEFNHVTVTDTTLYIHMPRMNYVSDWSVTQEQLQATTDAIRAAIKTAKEQAKILATTGQDDMTFNPGKKQCMFCVKKLCKAYNAFAAQQQAAKKDKPAYKKKSGPQNK